jgi:hypothetical protein
MKKRSSYTQTRIPLAIALITASFLSAFFLASFSHSTSKYWVAVVDLQSGHQISSGDLVLRDLDLRSSSINYLSKKLDPIGQVLTQNVFSDEIVSTEKISSTAVKVASSAVPLSIRSVDLAAGITVGDLVDIYWVIDIQNGELAQEPILILGNVLVLSADGKSANFGSDAAITVSIGQTQVLRLLAATTQGRLVVIRSNV